MAMLRRLLLAAGAASITAPNCGGSANFDPRYCTKQLLTDTGVPTCVPQFSGNGNTQLSVGELVPLRVRVENQASYDNSATQKIFVPGLVVGEKNVQIAFACKQDTCQDSFPDLLNFTGDVVYSESVGGNNTRSTFSMGPCPNFLGVDMCSNFPPAIQATACGCLTLTPPAGQDNIQLAEGGNPDSNLILAQIMMRANAFSTEPFVVHVSGDEGIFSTTGSICTPNELSATGAGTAQAEYMQSPPPPPPPQAPGACDPDVCDAIVDNNCDADCPKANCRPYADPPTPPSCPSGCGDKCGFTEDNYDTCELCASMTPFCKDADKCNFCFLSPGAKGPDDPANCDGYDASCDTTCAAFVKCSRGCVPMPPPPPPPPSPPRCPYACIIYNKCHSCCDLPLGACLYWGEASKTPGAECIKDCDDLPPEWVFEKAWGQCSSLCPVSASKDPHLHLPHGGRADFRGKDNTIFNLLTARDVALNVRFEESDFSWAKRLVHGTKMGAAYWALRTGSGKVVTVEFQAVKFDPVAIVREQGHRDVEVRPGQPALVVDDVQVAMLSPKALTVVNKKWRFSASTSPYPFGKKNVNKDKVLLDVSFQPLYDADADVVGPHGIIGQAYDGDKMAVDGKVDGERVGESTTAAQAEGAIEGSWEDYIVKSPFATDFKYSRFDATAAPHRDVSKLGGAKRAATVTVAGAKDVKDGSATLAA